MMFGLRKAQSSSVLLLRAFLAPVPIFRRPSTAVVIPSSSSMLFQLIPLVHQHPTAIPVILPSSFSCFRFYLKCGRYPLCSQRFATKKKKDKHDASEICVPLAERKNKRKKAVVDSDAEMEDMEDVDLDDQVTQDSDAENEEMEDVDLDDQVVTQDKKMNIVGLQEQQALNEAFGVVCNKAFGVDLTVTVLTTGFWPSYKSFDLNLSADMGNVGLIFTKGDLKEVSEEVAKYKIPLPLVDEKNMIEDFEQLVMECVEQLSRMLKADFSVIIKKQIEDLITWDYLERDGPQSSGRYGP